jgi:MtfA peptidase
MWPFRRRRAAVAALPDALWQAACARARVLSGLPPEPALRLRLLAAGFLQRKAITPVHGLELDMADRGLIASLCCLPVLKLGGHWLGGWHEVVVYPGAFRVRRQELEEASGVLHEWDEELAGEAWSEGPLILSWQDLLDDLAEPESGCNVVAHEIAHKLDLRDGVLDGTPPLPGPQLAAWVRDFSAAFEALNAALDRDEEPTIDPYAASAPEEFFAVVSEYHFAAPDVLAAEMPAVAAHLREFYGPSPLAPL